MLYDCLCPDWWKKPTQSGSAHSCCCSIERSLYRFCCCFSFWARTIMSSLQTQHQPQCKPALLLQRPWVTGRPPCTEVMQKQCQCLKRNSFQGHGCHNLQSVSSHYHNKHCTHHKWVKGLVDVTTHVQARWALSEGIHNVLSHDIRHEAGQWCFMLGIAI